MEMTNNITSQDPKDEIELANAVKIFKQTYENTNRILENIDLNGYEISFNDDTFTIKYLSPIICNTNSNCNPRCNKSLKN